MTSAALAAVTLGSSTTSPKLTVERASGPKITKGRKGLWTVKYRRQALANAIPSNSQCTGSEKRKLIDSIEGVDDNIRRAYQRWNRHGAGFKKWFGTWNAHDDENVKRRYKYAMDFMQKPFDNYNIMCCKSGRGACRHCARRGVLAYVMSYRNNGPNGPTKHSITHVRVCALSFRGRRKKSSLGWTMFHEIMHVTSNAGDKGYSARQCIANAKSNPERARFNAQAYMYYAQEQGKPGRTPISGGCDQACRDQKASDRASREAAAAAAEARRRRREAAARKLRYCKLNPTDRQCGNSTGQPVPRPIGGNVCWIKMPNGCKNHLSQEGAQNDGLIWFKDSRTGSAASSKRGCTAKADVYRRWCKSRAENCWGQTGSSCTTSKPAPRPREPTCRTDSTDKKKTSCTAPFKCCSGYEMAWKRKYQASCHNTRWLNARSRRAMAYTKCSAKAPITKPRPVKPTPVTPVKSFRPIIKAANATKDSLKVVIRKLEAADRKTL